MPIPDKELVMAFGPGKEPEGPSSACRRLAGLLGVPADKLDDFKHLLYAVIDEREEEEEPEEEGEDEEDGKGAEEY